MSENLRYWLWMQSALGEGAHIRNIIEDFGSAKELYNANILEWKMSPALTPKQINRLSQTDINIADEMIYTCESNGWSIIDYEDQRYPERLRNIYNPPCVLYVDGIMPDIDRLAVIGIVGTRKASTYAVKVAHIMSRGVTECGALVVSGGALGVDTAAHKGALSAGGKTVAVLAGGFDKVYPAEHTSLFKEICQKGLVLTEHRPDISAFKYNFPQRNRIVAGLSDALLITEAGAKSGTIITKDFALDYGVPIYAVPGNLTSAQSECTNNLIASMQGICAIDAKQIIDELGLQQKQKSIERLSTNENLIVQCLSNGEKSMDEIEEITKINIAKLNSLLTSLEIKSIIKRMPGGIYSLG